jgi:hypothetical protein
VAFNGGVIPEDLPNNNPIDFQVSLKYDSNFHLSESLVDVFPEDIVNLSIKQVLIICGGAFLDLAPLFTQFFIAFLHFLVLPKNTMAKQRDCGHALGRRDGRKDGEAEGYPFNFSCAGMNPLSLPNILMPVSVLGRIRGASYPLAYFIPSLDTSP